MTSSLDLQSLRFTVDRVCAHGHRSPLVRPFVTAARRTDTVDYVAVDVQVSLDGRTAIGQGSAAETVKVTGESAETIIRDVNGPIVAALLGRAAGGDVGKQGSGTLLELAGRIAGALPHATSAKAAVDVALHDAVARLLGVSVGELLTSRPEYAGTTQGGVAAGLGALLTPIQADMTVSLEDPATMAKHAREAREDGYRILKIKLGNDPAQDRARLAAVLAAVPDARLRLDANQGWTPREAIELMAAFVQQGLPVDLVEQPVAREDIAGLALVRRETEIPVMADEALWSPLDAKKLLDAEAADYFNIKLAKTGGLGPALTIAQLAHDAGVECMVGAMMEPRISITAAGHLAAVHPAVTMIDLDSPAWFAHNVPAGGYTEADGLFTLTGGPGLGLEYLAAEEDPLQ